MNITKLKKLEQKQFRLNSDVLTKSLKYFLSVLMLENVVQIF